MITLVIVPLHGLEHLFQKPVDELIKKERYCLWLAHRHEEQYEEKIQEIIEKEEGLQMAEAVLKDIRNSKRIFTEVMNKHYLITHQMELNKADQLIKEAKKETEYERKLRYGINHTGIYSRRSISINNPHIKRQAYITCLSLVL